MALTVQYERKICIGYTCIHVSHVFFSQWELERNPSTGGRVPGEGPKGRSQGRFLKEVSRGGFQERVLGEGPRGRSQGKDLGEGPRGRSQG